ncbi:MAG: twin-arginine translocase TatA/TatE family subunit [Desulfovibrio sp.]|nr:twin-arginine translocase TatA/TatE family subunit [Desulfovibrio sp.]MBI4958686.1 twin-arginine translocase TatA/TatE family subunit [Desulfovibrio sp.]
MHYSFINSPWQWLIILGIVILLFGPGRIGNLGRELGKSIKEFKGAMNDKDVTPEKIEDHSTQASTTTTTTTVNQTDKSKV